VTEGSTRWNAGIKGKRQKKLKLANALDQDLIHALKEALSGLTKVLITSDDLRTALLCESSWSGG
jgi:hypothetical protein